MGNANMKPVDAAKLEKELKKRGYSFNRAAVELGYSKAGFSSARKNGTISEPMLRGLKHYFNIGYEAIKPDLSEEKTEKVKDIDEAEKTAENAKFAVLDINGIDWVKVELHIRRAVAAALQDRGL